MPGRGAPAFRKRHVTPHHFIWHPRPVVLRLGGGAQNVTFKTAEDKLLSITLDKFIIPIVDIPVEIFAPIQTKVLDFSNFEELVKQPRVYQYTGNIGIKLGGSVDVTSVDNGYLIGLDDEEILLAMEDDAMLIYTYYSEKEHNDIKIEQLLKEDEEFLFMI